MKALMFDRLGTPAEVVSLCEVAVPEPAPGEVLVRVLSSPIIPGDALFTQGLYPEPVRPSFPRETAGNYGVGIVEKVGDGVAIAPNMLVAVTHKGLWADYAVAPEAKVIVLPPGFRPELGAEFMNLVTAWDLLERVSVRKGQWLLVTAGHASVSTILAQFARAIGICVLSIVRRRSDAIDLHRYGSERVLALDEEKDIRHAVLAATGGEAHGLVDCVGGALLGPLATTLAFGSQIAIYGGFDPAPATLHNLDIVLNGLEIRSYVYRYFFNGPGPADEARVRQILAMAQVLDIRLPVAGRYRLDQYADALRETGIPGRKYFSMADLWGRGNDRPHG